MPSYFIALAFTAGFPNVRETFVLVCGGGDHLDYALTHCGLQ